MAVFPIHSTDDYWAKAVELFTGYPVPPREGVFDHLIGNDGIPLMDVSFSDLPSTPDTSIYKVVDKLFWREANSNGIVYVQIYVPFYVPANGSRDRKVAPGTKLKLRQAKIELLGTSSLDDGTPLRGAYEGGEFGDNWSNRALHQYAYGGGRALEALNWGRTTARFSWGGLHVPIADAVDYNSFDRAADAFTRAAIFFDNQRHVLERWQSQLGKEDSAWRGQAAGVFADLIGKLNKLYHDYGEDMPRVGVASSRHAERLRRAREQFVNATNALHDEWLRWVDWLGNPLQHLHNVLLDVTKNIWDHNISQVDLKLWEQGVSGGSNSGPSQIEKTEEIAETAAANFDVGMNKYGHYEDMGAWKKIGEDALASWQDSVVENLGKAAKTALMSVRDAFSISLEPISARSGTRLSDDLQKDLLEKEKEDQKHEQEKRDKEIKAHEDDLNNKNLQMMHEQEENAKHLQEEQAKREKEREEAEKHLRDEQAKREKERDEAEKHLREEQERKQNERDAYEKHVREEQEKAQKEENHKREVQENHLRHEQEKKQNERDAYEKHVREEQEQKQKAQEERQEQQRQEQEKIRKEETHKQDARLADQERAQALVRSQEKADRDQERKRQEQVRKEQEARQEQLEQRQEQKREEQEKKQEQARIKTEAAYEERRKQEEARQAKLSGDQQHRQEQLEQRQEQQRKQEEARQAKLSGDQQHRQEQLEQRQEQQRKQEEARQARLSGDQQHRQEQLEQRQEQQRQEQTKRQHELTQEQDRRQHEVQQRYDQLRRNLPDLPDYHDSRTVLNPDGSVTTDFKDGGFTTVDPKEHRAVSVSPDGSVDFENLSPGKSVHNEDGSWSTVGPDGTVTTDYPDGHSTTIDPHRGQATTTYPDGKTDTVPLGHNGTLPASPGRGVDYSLSHPGYEQELYDNRSDDLTAPLGQRAGTTSPMSSPPMTPMLPPGMTTAGQISAGSKESEGRVRNFVGAGQQLLASRGAGGRNAGHLYDEAGPAQPSGAMNSGMPFMPPMGGQGGGGQNQTASSDRKRASWMAEEEDVWGTDEGGAPAVIGL